MAIRSTGPITMQDIQNEFGGANPINLSEYYRGGARVPNVPVNSSIPTSGAISLNDFYGATNVFLVTYEIIGGGGGGGYGLNNGAGGRGTFAPSGGASSFSGSGITTVTAAGGTGGENTGGPLGGVGTAGAASFYGPGGGGGGREASGQPAPSTSYGAGGGGGGGSSGGYLDDAGASGLGGNAGTRRTGTFTIVPGTAVTVNIGLGGAGGDRTYDGGRGANGFCRFTYNGITRNITSSTVITIS